MPSHAPTSSSDALAGLWRLLGQPEAALSRVTLTGAEPALPSSFAVGTAAQASIAASALAAAELDRLRSGREQTVSVNMRHAAVEFRSERYLRVEGGPAPELWDSIAGTYGCGDGRWVRLHTNFPHHREGVLAILGCAGEREAVAEALTGWKAEEFEQRAAEAKLVVTAMRSFAEWDAHPQGQAVAALPVMSLEKIGEAAPLTLPPGERPLSGVRVLDLTRIIAGPVAGRTLAAHGADVLLMTAPHLPSVEPLVIDTGRGKRTAQLDLRAAADKERFAALLRDAHVLVQGYRPGGIEALGFGPAQAAAIRPGIIYVTLSAYGPDGPWAGRRGFDSLVQTASGLNVAEAEAAGIDGPKPLPAQALDHASGYLMAYGAMTALARQRQEGGSWHVRVSLAQTGRWLRGLGRLQGGFSAADPSQEDVADLLEDSHSGFGRLTAVRHAGLLSETPPVWERPSMPLGSHQAVWPD